MNKTHLVTLPGYNGKSFFDTCTDLGIAATLFQRTVKLFCTDQDLEIAWELWNEKQIEK